MYFEYDRFIIISFPSNIQTKGLSCTIRLIRRVFIIFVIYIFSVIMRIQFYCMITKRYPFLSYRILFSIDTIFSCMHFRLNETNEWKYKFRQNVVMNMDILLRIFHTSVKVCIENIILWIRIYLKIIIFILYYALISKCFKRKKS